MGSKIYRVLAIDLSWSDNFLVGSYSQSAYIWWVVYLWEYFRGISQKPCG